MKNTDLPLISHRVHERYSPNLHKWLKRECHHGEDIKAWRYSDGRILIGHVVDGDVIGFFLGSILGGYGGHKCFCYPSEALASPEIEGFWEDYKKRGRCVADPQHITHFLNSGGRFREEDGGWSRVCTWCGVRQSKHIQEQVVTTEVWRDESAA